MHRTYSGFLLSMKLIGDLSELTLFTSLIIFYFLLSKSNSLCFAKYYTSHLQVSLIFRSFFLKIKNSSILFMVNTHNFLKILLQIWLYFCISLLSSHCVFKDIPAFTDTQYLPQYMLIYPPNGYTFPFLCLSSVFCWYL